MFEDGENVQKMSAEELQQAIKEALYALSDDKLEEVASVLLPLFRLPEEKMRKVFTLVDGTDMTKELVLDAIEIVKHDAYQKPALLN